MNGVPDILRTTDFISERDTVQSDVVPVGLRALTGALGTAAGVVRGESYLVSMTGALGTAAGVVRGESYLVSMLSWSTS